MSRSIAVAPSPSATTRGEGANYRLRSDLAQFCLPGATKDATQKLAYVDSICIFVLTIGFIGIKAPQLINKDPPPVVEMVPVEIVQIEPQQPPEPQPVPDTEPPPDAAVDMPQIATVVAADPSQVKFAIPVEGPVVFAPAKFAQAPPANPPKASPPRPTKFDPTKTDGGFYPVPSYPRQALEQRQQGTVWIDMVIDTNGVPVSVELRESSGVPVLDRHTLQWVKTKWRFAPGPMRYYYKDFEYALK